jgi:hypothetical protein
MFTKIDVRRVDWQIFTGIYEQPSALETRGEAQHNITEDLSHPHHLRNDFKSRT